MKRNINGKDVEIPANEAAEIQAEWDANAAKAEKQKLTDSKDRQKSRLRAEKLDSMLSVEFAEIDAAIDNASINAVGLK